MFKLTDEEMDQIYEAFRIGKTREDGINQARTVLVAILKQHTSSNGLSFPDSAFSASDEAIGFLLTHIRELKGNPSDGSPSL